MVQDETAEVAGRILALEDANDYPGFTGLIADPDRQGLFLCWLRGDVLPAEIADIVAHPGQPITVTRMDTPYSRPYLDSRVSPILANDPLGLQIGGIIHTVTVPEAGTGLIAGVLPTNPGVDPGTFAAQAAPILSAATGVPVTVEVANPAQPLAGTRQNDDTPWYGGATLLNYVENPARLCSSGFGIVADGKDYLLSAAHCFGFGLAEDVYNGAAPPNAKKIGRVEFVGDRNLSLDSERIRIRNGAAGTRVYGGGVGENEGDDPVVGVRRNVVNFFVSTSGAASGSHGLLKIVATRLKRVDVLGGRFVVRVEIGPVVKATALALGVPRGVAAGRGDSGGPVIMPEATNTNVYAVGTISSGDRIFNCAVYVATECAEDVFYPDITDILTKFGATLKPQPRN